MKKIFPLTVPLIAIAIVLISSSWCSSTNLSGDQTEISIVFKTAPEYVIDPEENGTIFNISGQVIVDTMDPRMYSISLMADSEDLPTSISPTSQIGSSSGIYPFTIMLKVPKLSEDSQYEITVSGNLNYLVGAPVSYSIGPTSVIMNIKVLDVYANPEDSGNKTSNKESPGLELNALGVVFVLVVIYSYYSKRQVRQ